MFGEPPAVAIYETEVTAGSTFGPETCQAMKLLYLDLGGNDGPDPELQMRYDVVYVSSYLEAMQRIVADYFHAFLISDGTRDAALLSFTAAVHQEAPELPTFVLSNWGPDLFSALDSIAPFALPISASHENTWIH